MLKYWTDLHVRPYNAIKAPKAAAIKAPTPFVRIPSPAIAFEVFEDVAAAVVLPAAAAAATNVAVCVVVTVTTLVPPAPDAVVVTTTVLVVKPLVWPSLPMTVYHPLSPMPPQPMPIWLLNGQSEHDWGMEEQLE
ncbi:unnamed protein product [Sphagnum balticum]